jgi:hypothetical protein
VNSTSAWPDHITTSVSTAPAAISRKPSHESFGAAARLDSSTGPAKYSTAISKKMMKKMSMFMPCTPSSR